MLKAFTLERISLELLSIISCIVTDNAAVYCNNLGYTIHIHRCAIAFLCNDHTWLHIFLIFWYILFILRQGRRTDEGIINLYNIITSEIKCIKFASITDETITISRGGMLRTIHISPETTRSDIPDLPR